MSNARAYEPRDAVLIDGCRTAVGRFGGALAAVRPDDLAARVISALVERAGIEHGDIEDVVLGCANQAGEDNRNVARMATLLAGLPVSVGGLTVNRLCGSGLQAVVNCAQAVRAGEGDLFIAGGVESMSRAPYVLAKPERAWDRSQQMYDTVLGWRFPNAAMKQRFPLESMGETAENVAAEYDVSRERQDAFALMSQQRWAAAHERGDFAAEIVPISVRKGREEVVVDTDEHPRPSTTADALAGLKPAFREGGTVTAGSSSGINDGAAAIAVASREYAQAHGLHVRGRVVASAVAGVDPRLMGIGPVPATRRALERAGITVDELDAVELNEAFAAQSLACIDELGLDDGIVNASGGSIAMGHPLGATGARLLVTLLGRLEREHGRFGLVTMCIGVGQGIAMVVEREGAE